MCNEPLVRVSDQRERPWEARSMGLQGLLVALELFAPGGTGGAPTDVVACGPSCYEALLSAFILDCRAEFGEYLTWNSAWGRSWLGPLQYVGPIDVAIQSRPWVGRVSTFPLLIDRRRDPGAAQCTSAPGATHWFTYGTESCDPDSTWVRFPTTELPIAVGSEYWIQLSGFLHPTASSPFWRCLHVTAHPTAIGSRRWAQVKALYR